MPNYAKRLQLCDKGCNFATTIYPPRSTLMKHSTLFNRCALAIALGVIAIAAPAAPVIDGNKVSLRMLAPHARQVMLDLSQHSPIAMQRDTAGWWTVTTPQLAPGMYTYLFQVDSMPQLDLGNAFTVRDVGNVRNLIIIDDASAPISVAVRNVPHGNVDAAWYESPAVGYSRRMLVYTPPGYDQSPQHYPVLYLLHGMGCDESSWLELGRTAQILDNGIASGKIEPMIVVMPNGHVDLQATPGVGADNMEQPGFLHKRDMEGTFERSMADIRKYVETHYRTRIGKRYRAIAGLSMGGYHSLYVSANNPDDYGYVGLFSAAINARTGVEVDLYKDLENKVTTQLKQHPWLYWIGIGKDDFLYKENAEFRAMLDRNDLHYIYHESQGGHSWENWRDYLQIFLPLLFK